jgi:hypothetical protein
MNAANNAPTKQGKIVSQLMGAIPFAFILLFV